MAAIVRIEALLLDTPGFTNEHLFLFDGVRTNPVLIPFWFDLSMVGHLHFSLTGLLAEILDSMDKDVYCSRCGARMM